MRGRQPNRPVSNPLLCKALLVAIATLAVLTVPAALAQEAPRRAEPTDNLLTDEEREWISRHPEIRLGIDPEFFPFEFVDEDGRYSGIASDYIALLNERLGINMVVRTDLAWKEATDLARAGEIDVLPCIGITEERKAYLAFSNPYIEFYRAIITRSDEPFIGGIKDVANRAVAVQKNSSHEGFLRDRTRIEPRTYKTLAATLMAVSGGQADAMIGNVTSSTYWIRRLNLTNLKIAAPAEFEAHQLHFAVRSDWPILVRIINKGLASITAEERREIRERWVQVPFEPGVDMARIWGYAKWTGLAAALIAGIFLLWNYSLQKEIRVRADAERRLAEKTKELERANERLMELDRLKSMFMASMSHELRTPLNSIIGFTELLLMDMSGPINEEQRKQLKMVKGSSKHLLDLINEILDLSKIEAGQVRLEMTDFKAREFIEEVANSVSPIAKKKGLALKLDVPETIWIHSDRRRLSQVLLNLIGNAVKFTETGNITIELREQKGSVIIVVADTGPGIEAEDLAKLFQPFHQIDMSTTKNHSGTGLGLYLTRKIMTLLGGEVTAESTPGAGSRFIVTFPSIADKGAAG